MMALDACAIQASQSVLINSMLDVRVRMAAFVCNYQAVIWDAAVDTVIPAILVLKETCARPTLAQTVEPVFQMAGILNARVEWDLLETFVKYVMPVCQILV
jgi:hypothetical protein